MDPIWDALPLGVAQALSSMNVDSGSVAKLLSHKEPRAAWRKSAGQLRAVTGDRAKPGFRLDYIIIYICVCGLYMGNRWK
jgi:hypothetical protein